MPLDSEANLTRCHPTADLLFVREFGRPGARHTHPNGSPSKLENENSSPNTLFAA